MLCLNKSNCYNSYSTPSFYKKYFRKKICFEILCETQIFFFVAFVVKFFLERIKNLKQFFRSKAGFYSKKRRLEKTRKKSKYFFQKFFKRRQVWKCFRSCKTKFFLKVCNNVFFWEFIGLGYNIPSVKNSQNQKKVSFKVL